ncbi:MULTISPECIES: hypothetical protein [unclassified Sphingomonas]|uniref:hypothetical protein n=1 Tax=unclassified Sphingomonas TaxID=196159 RepID=UPI000A4C8473|nr:MULTISPECIES: hypothetical protein [unclassified Sphingomonas]
MVSDLRLYFPDPCSESWSAMVPSGCCRMCSKCERPVHDLTRYDIAGVEKLLHDEPGACVRACIDASGAIATKPGPHGNMRRIVAIVGASAALLIASPALARDHRAKGAIVGVVETSAWKVTVTAKDEHGNSYKAKAKRNHKYKIKNVPPGVYSIEFSTDCDENWTVENVVVKDEEIKLDSRPGDAWRCITVGLVQIVQSDG